MPNNTSKHRTLKGLSRWKETNPASYSEHYKQWIHIEALEARLCGVEALFHESAMSSLVDLTAPSATFESIEARILQLEAQLGVFYTPEIENQEHPFTCPAENCFKEFSDRNSYYYHLRTSKGAGHRALKLILERKIARAFESLAKEDDDQASKELIAMLFSPVKRAFEAMTNDLLAAAKASRQRRARSETEEVVFDSTIWDSQSETGAINQRQSKRRRRSTATASNKAKLMEKRTGSTKTYLSDSFEGETLADVQGTLYPVEDQQQSPLEIIENDRNPSCQIAGAKSKPDNDNGNGRMRSAAPSPTDDRYELASVDEEWYNQLDQSFPLLPGSLFENVSTMPDAELNQQLVTSTIPTADHMNSEPTYDEDGQTRELFENFDAFRIPEVPNLPWSAPSYQ
ncbi:MAG: hypothetical protein Q9188_001617 [Gyalolechia gomerana]